MIAVYNYKGGVAKTTNVLNLGSVLAHNMQKHVLLVDCDPQCNLTSFFIKDIEKDDDEDDAGGPGPAGTAGSFGIDADEFLRIIRSTSLDSEKTDTLRRMLATADHSVIQCFTASGVWNHVTKRFSGVPDWRQLEASLVALDGSSRSAAGASGAGGAGGTGGGMGGIAASVGAPQQAQLPFIDGDSINPSVLNMDDLDLEALRQGGGGQTFTHNVFTMLRSQFFQGRYEIPDADLNSIYQRSLDFSIPDDQSTLWLLPGSSKIVEFERRVVQTPGGGVEQILRMGFRRLINKIALAKGIDIVLIDFGPSSSQMNLQFLSTCDFILPPSFPDFFNVASLDGFLFSVIPTLLEARAKHLTEQDELMATMIQNLTDNKGKQMTRQVAEEFRFPDSPPRILFTV